jgi:hypothetical protein
MDRYPQLDQMNRTGEILKYLDVMRYKRGMDAYTRKRNAELDAERNKQNALQRSVTQDSLQTKQNTRNALAQAYQPPMADRADQDAGMMGVPRPIPPPEQAGQAIAVAGGDPNLSTQLMYPDQKDQNITDIERQVQRANEQSMIDNGRPLSPGEQNRVALEFKRAQAREIAVNRLAEKTVDAQTAQQIKYNGMIGSRLAEIATEQQLRQARGDISPQEKKQGARAGVTGKLATMAQRYIQLNNMGAMVNVDRGTVANIIARTRATKIGQAVEGMIGTDAQSLRNAIQSMKPLLLQDIRQSTDMGARGLDSEKELEFYLKAATDETFDIQANIAAIVVLDEAYGDGQAAEELRNLADQSVVKRIRTQGQNILAGGGKKTVTDMGTDPPGEPPAPGARWSPTYRKWFITSGGKHYPVEAK